MITRDEHVARGKAARAAVPRSANANLDDSVEDRDPVEVLKAQAETRVPELVPIRHARMMASPFAFYRGAAAVMAGDLARVASPGLTAQLCGDAHLSNFGAFASPERRLVFDVNDFDETLPGPFEWDLKRLAASIEIAGRENGWTRAQRRDIVAGCVRAYRGAMAEFADMRTLDLWYRHLEVEEAVAQLRSAGMEGSARRTERGMGKARRRDSLQAFERLVSVVDGRPTITADPPLITALSDVTGGWPPEKIRQGIDDVLENYSVSLQSDRRALLKQFTPVDAARKVVGVGSVGTRCFIVLLLGRDEQDPLVLQVKEAQRSVLEPFLGASRYSHAGERVVAGQRLMQAASDIFLGWHSADGIDGQTRDFYVRQLRDWKGSFEPTAMRPPGMAVYADACAWTLARAHARSGDRVAIAAYLGKSATFDDAVAEFAHRYADRNERDHAALEEAVRLGRLEATAG